MGIIFNEKVEVILDEAVIKALKKVVSILHEGALEDLVYEVAHVDSERVENLGEDAYDVEDELSRRVINELSKILKDGIQARLKK